MAVFPDRIVQKNSSDSRASIIAQIGPGGSSEITQGELVLGFQGSSLTIYSKNGNDDVVYFEAGSTTARCIVQALPPTFNLEGDPLADGDMWYQYDTALFYVYYNSDWQLISSDNLAASPSPPAGPSVGDIWIDTDTNILHYWDGSSWTPIEVSVDVGVTSVDVQGGTGLTATGGPIIDSGTITVDLDDTAVTPGTYSAALITVDQQGRITSAADGFAGAAVIDDLLDVDTSTLPPASGQALLWNGSYWVPGTVSTGGGGGGTAEVGRGDGGDFDFPEYVDSAFVFGVYGAGDFDTGAIDQPEEFFSDSTGPDGGDFF